MLSESSNHCEFEKFHIHDVIPCEGPEMIQPTHHLVHVKKKMFVEGATLKLATTSEVWNVNSYFQTSKYFFCNGNP